MFDFRRSYSEISFKEFLHFLRTAYQYQICESNGNKLREVAIECQDVGSQLVTSQVELSDAIIKKSSNKNKRKNGEERRARKKNAETPFNEVRKSSSFPMATPKIYGRESPSDINSSRKLDIRDSLEFLMKCKLNQAIEEGLMGTVIPFFVRKLVIPSEQEDKEIQTEVARIASKKIYHQQEQRKKRAIVKRKSVSEMSEVEIHVCDEVNNLRKDFKCSQSLLVSKMVYFAEVARGQNLENMDITVHCDVEIFEWLMQWVKKSTDTDGMPLQLDVANIIPLLVAAEFFQMKPLFEDCLVFCRRNIAEILETSTKLHCLNDKIIARLVDMFSNSELEALNDPEEKLKNRLFCKLIARLAEPVFDVTRGHYASLANLHRCVGCGKLILWHCCSQVPCHPKNMHVDTCGNTRSIHVRDTNWSLNEHIKQLRHELHSWRMVYWRLWAECHFLQCASCTSLFPVHQARWCLHHPDRPQFFPAEQHSTAAYPIGRYPCCGERAYRFEALPHQSGCQFKDHIPYLDTEGDLAAHKIFVSIRENIALEPPQLQFPERITYFLSPNDCSDPDHSGRWKAYWWEGLELAPAGAAPGNILSKPRNIVQQAKEAVYSSVATTDNELHLSSTEVDSDGDHQYHMPRQLHYRTGSAGHASGKRQTGPPQWISIQSTRQNQDNQREYEECVMLRISSVLTRRTCGEAEDTVNIGRKGATGQRNRRWGPHVTPPGGTYIRLEREWKEAQVIEKKSHYSIRRRRLDESSTASTSSRTGFSVSALHSARMRNRGRFHAWYRTSVHKS